MPRTLWHSRPDAPEASVRETQSHLGPDHSVIPAPPFRQGTQWEPAASRGGLSGTSLHLITYASGKPILHPEPHPSRRVPAPLCLLLRPPGAFHLALLSTPVLMHRSIRTSGSLLQPAATGKIHMPGSHDRNSEPSTADVGSVWPAVHCNSGEGALQASVNSKKGGVGVKGQTSSFPLTWLRTESVFLGGWMGVNQICLNFVSQPKVTFLRNFRRLAMLLVGPALEA